MFKRVLIVTTACLALTSVLFAPSQEVFAQESAERITLSPAVSRPTLNAGDKVEGKLTVINDGTIGYTFLMYARPFSVIGENYDPNYTVVNERTEAYQWVQFDQTKVRLEPGERVEVGYTVQTPESARSGGHYAVLFAETQPPEDQPASVVRKKRVGTLLYMRVNGTIEEKGTVESWTAQTLQTKKPVTSALRLKNSGNIHYEANVNATYKNIFGKTQFELNQQLLVLPGTTRKINVSWQDAPYIGIFKAGGTVKFLDKTEVLPVRYIILLPYSFILIAGVVLVAAGATVFFKKRQNKKSTHPRAKRR